MRGNGFRMPSSPSPTAWRSRTTPGVDAVIQPGGSIRDNDSVQYCDEHGVAMVMTGFRHFKH